jgi:adenosylhomocysteine nucleosidase
MTRRLLATMVCLASLVLVASCASVPRQNAAPRPAAVLGVTAQDVAELHARLADAVALEIEGIQFTSGRIAGRPVVVSWTGVGKVNAAMVTTLLIEHFKPTKVVLAGIAGGIDPNLEPGDLVVAAQTAHHDMGYIGPVGLEPGGVRNRLTDETNPTFFPADPDLLAAARHAASTTPFDPIDHRNGQRPPRVVLGTLVTGDTFVASKIQCRRLAEMFEADAVDMEGAAVAQICHQRGVGCLVLRSIADRADESAVVDKQKFYALAAKNSARLVVEVLANLGE